METKPEALLFFRYCFKTRLAFFRIDRKADIGALKFRHQCLFFPGHSADELLPRVFRRIFPVSAHAFDIFIVEIIEIGFVGIIFKADL